MMSRRAILCILVSLLCLLGFLSPLATAILLNLPSSESKCVSEEIRANVVVLANYIVVKEDRGRPLPTISAKGTSLYGNNLHLNENVTSSQFAFTTPVSGNYLACFWVDGLRKGIGAGVNLDWKIGIAAKDWLTVARKEKIEGVELDLRKLAAAVETIHENLLYLRTREADMMAMNETTKSRLAWYGAAALEVCIGVSLCQLWHSKCFFQKKKLI